MKQRIMILMALILATVGNCLADSLGNDMIVYPDSMLTIPRIRAMAGKNPDEALAMLNQAEEKKLIANYKIN